MAACFGAEPLKVVTDFEGASVRDVEIDQATRTIQFMPGGDPKRGWPCWWCFRVEGVTPGETITLKLRGSTAVTGEASGLMSKPLAASWAMPTAATFSTDGKHWSQSRKGSREDAWMLYELQSDSPSVTVAWGPPFTPTSAAELVRDLCQRSPHAKAGELCRSREGRPVPMVIVQEGDRPPSRRFGVWVQARQHAWESGSSWVAQGFAEWLVSDDPDAGWLRQHAEIHVTPIMDIDNAATGNGGKDAFPHDHNRDWSDQPHWPETAAAQQRVRRLIEAGRMDVFLDLHNPAPGDPTFFYILADEYLQESQVGLREQFMKLTYERIIKIRPQVPMSSRPKPTGPSYHPLWRQISANWVVMNGNPHTVSLCLETIWNSPASTTAGYRAVGASLAAATQEYLKTRPLQP